MRISGIVASTKAAEIRPEDEEKMRQKPQHPNEKLEQTRAVFQHRPLYQCSKTALNARHVIGGADWRLLVGR